MARARTFALDDDSVVVVIGSGAGGATLANALAQRGIGVVCLEAGRRLSMSEIVNDEAAMFGKFTWLDERIGEGDALANFPVWNCKTVGGTTMHWTAAAPRLQAHEFRARSTYGALEGASLMDWPLSLEELTPYYERAEDLMGVTGSHGIPPLPANNNFLVMQAGAARLGYRDVDTNTLAINSIPRDGRPPCQQLGFCTSGCATRAKWCTLYTEIPKAEASGHFELRPECMAVRIVVNASGRASAVRYRNGDGELLEQQARVVCVAGNATETTRLLLNSADGSRPAGLANSSGELGRNYMRHNMVAVMGVMPGEVHHYKGAQVAGVIRDESRHDPARGFVGGFLMHTLLFTPETIAKTLLAETWGGGLTRVMERYRDFALLLVMGEDPPQPDNRITVHPTRKDRYGLPVPVVTYHHHPNSRAMMQYAEAAGRRVYTSVGAEQTYAFSAFPATHNLGTARMGDDPSRSVCNRWGQTHDVANLFISDGSVFPSAGCENPTLTIVALALRQGDYLAEQLDRGAF